MSNTDDLLCLAKALGKNAFKSNDSECVAAGDSDDKPYWFMPEENNDQFVQVEDWVCEQGILVIDMLGVTLQIPTDESWRFRELGLNRKQNIINISIQVARYLEGK